MKPRTFVFLSLLSLFACLMWPGQGKAQDVAECIFSSNSCSLTIPANGGDLFVIGSNSTSAPTDGCSNSYSSMASVFHWSDFFGTNAETESSWYSTNVSCTGTKTVTGGSGGCCGEAIWISGSKVVTVGNPLDTICQTTGHNAIPSSPTSGNFNVSGAPVCGPQSTQTNDVFIYFILCFPDNGSGSFGSCGGANNGPTVNSISGGAGTRTWQMNVNTGTFNLIPSGAPTSFTLSSGYNNTSGSTMTWGAQLIALKSGVSASPSPVRHRVIQDKYRVPRHRERILLGAIMPVWLRRKEKFGQYKKGGSEKCC
jgi:hypothetical protein